MQCCCLGARFPKFIFTRAEGTGRQEGKPWACTERGAIPLPTPEAVGIQWGKIMAALRREHRACSSPGNKNPLPTLTRRIAGVAGWFLTLVLGDRIQAKNRDI